METSGAGKKEKNYPTQKLWHQDNVKAEADRNQGFQNINVEGIELALLILLLMNVQICIELFRLILYICEQVNGEYISHSFRTQFG